MPNVLVTGGAGFIGSHLATAVAARGNQVTVFDNLCAGKPENIAGLRGVTLVGGDIAECA